MNNKVTPKILPGFMELLPEDQILFNKIKDTIREVYESFGFLPLDTPTIEYSEVLLAKAGGETEKQIYRFNKGDNDLSLRFDLTVPLARYVAQHSNALVFPFKRYQIGKVFRGERPQKGRFREFYQCDIDIIGNETLDLAYDAEMPAVIYNVFKKLNIGGFTIKLNNRKILNGFFEAIGLNDKTADVLRIIDKIEKIGEQNVREELLKLGASSEATDKIMDFVATKGTNVEKITKLKAIGIENEKYFEGISELEKVCEYLRMFGVEEEAFQIELTIARGLDYYTGTVYETMLNDYPSLGSVCSGGRYENLAEYYTKQRLPGVGVSIGLTRLFSQLKENKIIKSESKSLVKALVLPMDEGCAEFAVKAAGLLRESGIPSDIYYGGKGMKQKMKYANRSGIPYVLIIGENEVKENAAALKNMNTGEQQTVSVAGAAEIIKGDK
ncbi:MAG: histidine--tRNA ligase [Clostridiales bacterium]|nr:histidine--tRNA ligase [Clostridiales bacterium]